jgi:GAF domain-containing protein/ActR/RegA family two-component response regulator
MKTLALRSSHPRAGLVRSIPSHSATAIERLARMGTVSVAIGLVGAGKGGAALLDLLLAWSDAAVTVVVDLRPDAPGLQKARALGIPTAPHHLDVFSHRIDVVLEVTGRAEVLEDLVRAKPAHVEIIGAASLRFFWTLLQRQVKAAHQLRVQLDLAVALGSVLAPRGQIAIAAQKLAQACEVDRCTFLLVDEATGLVTPVMSQYATGESNERLWSAFKSLGSVPLADVPFVAEARNRRGPIEIEDGASSPLLPPGWVDLFGTMSLLVLPIVRHDGRSGVCVLDYCREPRRFTPEQIALGATLTSQVALALENAHLRERAEERAEKLTALSALTQLITSTRARDRVFCEIAKAAATLLGGKLAQVWVEDPVMGVLRIAGSFGLAPGLERSLLEFPEIPRGRGVTASVFESRTAEYVADVQDDARWLNKRLVRALGLRAVAVIPLMTGEGVAGSLVIHFETRRVFSPEERELMHLLAGQAAVTIENTRFFEESERRRRVAESLAETGRLITQSLDPEELGRRVTRSLRGLLGGHAAALFRQEPESDDPEVIAVSRDDERASRPRMVRPLETVVARLTIRARQPVMIPDVITDARIALAPDVEDRMETELFRAILAVPLAVQSEVIGALLLRDRTGRVFTSEETALAQAVADQAAVALENARLYAEATRRQRQAEELARLAQVVTASLELPEVFERVVRAATGLLPESSGRIWVVEGDRIQLRSEAGIHGVPKVNLALGEGLTGEVALTRLPIVVEDMQNDPRTVSIPWARQQGHLSFAGLPLMVGERLVGVLTLVSRVLHRFSSGEMQILGAFGTQAAIAIENARLFQESRARQARLESLMQLTGELTRLQPVEPLLVRIAEDCGRLLGTDSAGFRLVDGDELVVVGTAGDSDQIMSTARLQFGESLSGLVAATGKPLLVRDPADDPRVILAHREALRRAGHRAFLGVPVKIGDRVVGVLSVRTRRPEGFSGEDVAIATAFAAQAAIALENARLYSETERRRSVAQQLADLGQLISRSLELEVVGQKIVEGLRTLLGAKASALYRLDPVSGDLRAHAVAGEIGPLTVLSAGTGLAGLAVREGEPVVTSNIVTDSRVVLPLIGWEKIERELARAALAVPLLVHGTVVGVLAVGDREGRLFSDDDVRLAQVFAGQAVLALENARLYEEARTQLERTQTLLVIGQTVSATLDLTETLRRVATETQQALHPDMVGAYLADEEEKILRPIAGSRVPNDLIQAFRDCPFPLKGHRFVEEAWQHGQTVWAEDVATDPRIDREVFARLAHGSVAFVPIIAKDRPFGGLFLVWETQRPPLTVEERSLAEGICRQAAIAVGNARLYDEVRQTLEELRRTQEQLSQAQKMEAVGRLAGGVAHDFNNLLMVIMGRSDLLRRDPATGDPVRRSLETIHKAAGTAADLTRQLLAFSRKQALQPRILNLNTVASGINRMLRRLIGDDIVLDAVLAPDLGCVKADPSQIEQILLNLAINARDAMPTGGRLTIETANVEVDAAHARGHLDARPGPHVMLSVSDTGIGMSREILAHLFEPFFTTKEVGKGTGLGLSTVYGIVKQSGGWVWVDSEPGAGATFTICLPRVPNTSGATEGTTKTCAAPGGTETILLVEDNNEVLALTRDVLHAAGYTVLGTPNGAEALRIAERHPRIIHLLLTDLVMPGLSGREVAHRLTALRSDMAVLYMSGYADHAVAHHGTGDPDGAFIQKPIAHDALLRKVRELLDQRPATVHQAPLAG